MYLDDFVDYQLGRRIKLKTHNDDIRQEIALRLLLVWRKYQRGKLEYFSINYAKLVVKTTISDYVESHSNKLDKTAPFRSQEVLPIDHQDAKKIVNPSTEFSAVIREAQSLVMGLLNTQELCVYDMINEGHTRNATCKHLKISSHTYTKIRLKIKELFKKYI